MASTEARPSVVRTWSWSMRRSTAVAGARWMRSTPPVLRRVRSRSMPEQARGLGQVPRARGRRSPVPDTSEVSVRTRACPSGVRSARVRLRKSGCSLTAGTASRRTAGRGRSTTGSTSSHTWVCSPHHTRSPPKGSPTPQAARVTFTCPLRSASMVSVRREPRGCLARTLSRRLVKSCAAAGASAWRRRWSRRKRRSGRGPDGAGRGSRACVATGPDGRAPGAGDGAPGAGGGTSGPGPGAAGPESGSGSGAGRESVVIPGLSGGATEKEAPRRTQPPCILGGQGPGHAAGHQPSSCHLGHRPTEVAGPLAQPPPGPVPPPGRWPARAPARGVLRGPGQAQDERGSATSTGEQLGAAPGRRRTSSVPGTTSNCARTLHRAGLLPRACPLTRREQL